MHDGVRSVLNSKLNARTLLVVLVPLYIFAGGLLLLLFALGVLSLQGPDSLDRIIGNSGEILLVTAMGIALLFTSIYVAKSMRFAINRSEWLKHEVSHHLRNSLQTVVLDLDLLKEEAVKSKNMKDGEYNILIDQAREASLNLLSVLEEVTSDQVPATQQSISAS